MADVIQFGMRQGFQMICYWVASLLKNNAYGIVGYICLYFEMAIVDLGMVAHGQSK